MRIAVSLFVMLTFLPLDIRAQQRRGKKEEDYTQSLEVAPDPPPAVTAETARLEHLVSPLSGKGLLSQQVRDALKSLRKRAGRGQIVKIRAFVAGTGDQRRVQAIVSETFFEKKQPIPAVSTIQVGLLPHEGAQVVLEAVAVGRKAVNPNGLAYLSGMGGYNQDPPGKPAAMLDKAVADLTQAARLAGSEPGDVLRVTCLLSSLDTIAQVRTRLAGAFPAATITAVQALRGHDRALAECEAVARLRRKPSKALEFLNPAEMNPSPMYSKAALVGSNQVIFTGSQMAFHSTEEDVHLAFQRLAKVLEAAKSSMKSVAFSSIYSLSSAITAKIRDVRFEYYDKARPPASTLLQFEGLPSMDASFALELVAVPE